MPFANSSKGTVDGLQRLNPRRDSVFRHPDVVPDQEQVGENDGKLESLLGSQVSKGETARMAARLLGGEL